MTRSRRGPGAMLRGALDIQLGREIMKVFGAGAPWVLMFFIMPILSTISYFLWHTHGFIIILMFIMVASILSFWELRMTHTKSQIGKAIRLITINFWVLWLCLATFHGIWSRPTFDIFIVGGFLLCAMSNMRTFASRGDDESGMINWNQIDEKAGFDGKTRWTQLPNVGKIIRGKIKLKDGLTAKHIMNQEDALKSLMGLPQNGLRFNVNPDDVSEVEIRIVPEDLLKHDLPWVRSPYAGKSIADGPIRIGTYEDGEPAYVNLYTKGGARHIIVSGMNGSGKTVGMRIIMLDAAERIDCRVMGIDVAKTEQTFGPMANALDILVSDVGPGALFMTRLKTVIKERAAHLGRNGYASWQPGCGLDFLVVAVDEGASFVNESDDFTRVVETARSAGISLIMAIQRASHTNMSTDARAQFGSTLCFGVKDAMDARFVLSDEVLDAGAHPEMWKAEKQGYCYLEASGVAIERHATPIKTMYLDVADLSEASKYIVNRDVDSFTKRAFGEKFYMGEKYGNMKINAKDETDDDIAKQHVDAQKQDLARDMDGFQEEDITPFDEKMILESESDGPLFSFEDETPKKKASPAEARAIFDKHMERLVSEGKSTFAARDLYPVLEETGRVREWIHLELNRRKKNGSIVHNSEDGTYTVVNAEDDLGELIEK